MSFVFQCHGCLKNIQVGEDAVGRAVQCNGCAAKMRVPEPSPFKGVPAMGEPLSSFEQPQTPASSSPFMQETRSARRSLKPVLLIAICGGGGVLLLFIAVIAVSSVISGGMEGLQQNAGTSVSSVSSASSTSGSSASMTPGTSRIHSSTKSNPDKDNTSSGNAASSTRLQSKPINTLPKESNTSKPAAPWENVSSEDKSTTSKPTKWENKIEEGGGGIHVDPGEGLTFGPPGCPVLVSQKTVWDVLEHKVRCELQGDYSRRGISCLSPDGRWFAAADKSENQQDTRITVWDTTTGKQHFSAPGNTERFADLVVLSNDRLFLGGRLSNRLNIWNLDSGNYEKEIEIQGIRRLGNDECSISLDGDYLAAPAHDKLIVVKISTGKVAAVMDPPKLMARPELDASNSGRALSARLESIFVFSRMASVKFSPDLQELAAVSTHPRTRLLCWSNHGELIYDEPFTTDRRASWEHSMQWFPDRKAWLVERDVIDRESGQVVLSVKEGFAQDLRLHVHDANHLVGTFPDRPEQLEVLEIPWEDIRATLAVMNDEETPALLGSTIPVDIRIELDDLRGDGQETRQALESALKTRLERDGIVVQRGAATFFRMKFSEKAGDTLPIVERQSPFDRRSVDTGRTATEAKGALVVELITPAEVEPIWREMLSSTSSRSYSEEITDQTIRKSMMERIAREVEDLNFPNYIPKSKELLALPVVFQ